MNYKDHNVDPQHPTSLSAHHTSSPHSHTTPTHSHLQIPSPAFPSHCTHTYSPIDPTPYYLSPPSSIQTDNNASPPISDSKQHSPPGYQRTHPSSRFHYSR